MLAPFERFEVYPSKWKLMAMTLASGLFVVVGVSLGIGLPNGTVSGRTSLAPLLLPVSVYLGIPLFLFGSIVFARRLLDRRPILVLDATGVEIHGFESLKFSWSDIAEIRAFRFGTEETLDVVLNDLEAAARRAGKSPKRLALSQRKSGAAVMIPRRLITGSLEEIVGRANTLLRISRTTEEPTALGVR